MATLALHAAFDDIGAVHAALGLHGAERLAETFLADGVRVQLSLPADRVDALKARLRDATRDRVRIITG
jgi:putative IMPACT (imprinted ancient) family translation regulator